MFKKFFNFDANLLLNQKYHANIEIKARTAILQDFYQVKFCMKKNLIFLFIQHQ